MTKVVQLADDAYDALARQKREGESFSDVVRRNFPRRPLADLAMLRTAMTPKERKERDRLWELGRDIQAEELGRSLRRLKGRSG